MARSIQFVAVLLFLLGLAGLGVVSASPSHLCDPDRIYFPDDLSGSGLALPTPAGSSTPLLATINIPDPFVVSDLSIVGLKLSSTVNMNQISLSLKSPSGREVQLWKQSCTSAFGLAVTFDSRAPQFSCTTYYGAYPNPANYASAVSSYQPPLGSLEEFNGEQSAGTWTLIVSSTSASASFSGLLLSWGLQFRQGCRCASTFQNWDDSVQVDKTGVDVFIPVETPGSVRDIAITLLGQAADINDLQVTLIAPGGAGTVVLSGGCANFPGASITFSDRATNLWGGNCGNTRRGRTFAANTVATINPSLFEQPAQGIWTVRLQTTVNTAQIFGIVLHACLFSGCVGRTSSTVRPNAPLVVDYSSTTPLCNVVVANVPVGGDPTYVEDVNVVVRASYDSPAWFTILKVALKPPSSGQVPGVGAVLPSVPVSSAQVMLLDGTTLLPSTCPIGVNTVPRINAVFDDTSTTSPVRTCPVDTGFSYTTSSFSSSSSSSGLQNIAPAYYPTGSTWSVEFSVSCSSFPTSAKKLFIESVTLEYNCVRCSDAANRGIGPKQYSTRLPRNGFSSTSQATSVPVVFLGSGAVRQVWIQGANVEVASTSLWSNIQFVLTSPSGTEAILRQPVTTCAQTALAFSFSDDAVLKSDTSCASGDTRTLQPFESLASKFQGETARGTWAFTVRQITPPFGTVRVYDVSIMICTDDDCRAFSSTNSTVVVAPSTTTSVPLRVVEDFSITDVNVIDVTITHALQKDLALSLVSPGGISVALWNAASACTNLAGLRSSFDDGYGIASTSCNWNSGITLRSKASLSQYRKLSALGTWTLQITNAGNATGTLKNWGLQFNCKCTAQFGLIGGTSGTAVAVNQDEESIYEVSASVTGTFPTFAPSIFYTGWTRGYQLATTSSDLLANFYAFTPRSEISTTAVVRTGYSYKGTELVANPSFGTLSSCQSQSLLSIKNGTTTRQAAGLCAGWCRTYSALDLPFTVDLTQQQLASYLYVSQHNLYIRELRLSLTGFAVGTGWQLRLVSPQGLIRTITCTSACPAGKIAFTLTSDSTVSTTASYTTGRTIYDSTLVPFVSSGSPAEGTWTLLVEPGTSSGNEFRLTSWSLEFNCGVSRTNALCKETYVSNTGNTTATQNTISLPIDLRTLRGADETLAAVRVSVSTSVQTSTIQVSLVRKSDTAYPVDRTVVLVPSNTCGVKNGPLVLSFTQSITTGELTDCGSGDTFVPVSDSLNNIRGLALKGIWELRISSSATGYSVWSWSMMPCADPTGYYVLSYPALNLIPSNPVAPLIADGTDFGNVVIATTKTNQFRISSSGWLRIENVTLAGTSSGRFQVVSYPTLLEPNNFCGTTSYGDIFVSFSSPIAGTFVDTLIITTALDVTAPYILPLRASAILPVISINGGTGFAFTIAPPDAPATAPGTLFTPTAACPPLATTTNQFRVNNTGSTGPVVISSITVSSTAFSVTPTSIASLASGATSILNVKFQPPSPGLYNAVVSLAYQAAEGNSTFTFNVQGRGAQPIMQVTNVGNVVIPSDTPASTVLQTDFGTLNVLTPVTKTFTISNVGDAGTQLNISSIAFAITGSAFSFSCGSTPPLLVGASSISCTVTFTPPSVCGDFANTLLFVTNQCTATQVFSLRVAAHVVLLNGPTFTGCTALGSVNTSPGRCYTTLPTPVITATDNCNSSISTVVTGPVPAFPANNAYQPGTYQLVYSTTSSTMVSATCNYTFTVVDNEPPVIACPKDIFTTSCKPRVWYLTPVSADNCRSSASLTAGRISGAEFPVGATTVTYTATDGVSSVSCSFKVTVTTATCPAPTPADQIDSDGDGFAPGNGDCCETPDQCHDPYLVNPGAVEIPGNGIDDNCNGRVDEEPSCSLPYDQRLLQANRRGLEIIPRSLGICERVDDDDDRSWGYVFYSPYEPRLTLADGNVTRTPSELQTATMRQFGNVFASKGPGFVMSTGAARMPGELGYTGTNMDMGTVARPPSRWLREQPNGRLPFPSTCGNALIDAYDSVNFLMHMRQPTNARGFAVRFLFAAQQPSGRYPPTNECEPQKDFFLLLTNAKSSPHDGNIAVDDQLRSITTLNTDRNLWSRCSDFTDLGSCSEGPFALLGTDYRGATRWLTVGANQDPGKMFYLNFVLFEAGSHVFDSTAFVDQFFYVLEESTVPTYGPRHYSDLKLSKLSALRTVSSTGAVNFISFEWEMANLGPDLASDIYLSFTPPKGTRFLSALSNNAAISCSVLPAGSTSTSALRRCPIQQSVLPRGRVQGSITLSIDPGVTGTKFMRVTSSCSSIETEFANNYRVVSFNIRA